MRSPPRLLSLLRTAINRSKLGLPRSEPEAREQKSGRARFSVRQRQKLAEITAQGKPHEQLTADELDYVQKASGFVNTFANLSSAEKSLYDKAVASGNTEAAAGIAQIALIRMG